MRRLFLLLLLALLTVLAVLVVDERGAAGPTQRVRDGRVAITLTDFRMTPQRIRTRPGRTTFVIRNQGRLSHAFRIRRGEREVLVQPSLGPGETAEATAELARGDYRAFDPLSNYEELGMWGTVVAR